MSNSKWYAFQCWLAATIADWLPEMVKRQVLYCLEERVYAAKPELANEDAPWGLTYERLYEQLRD